MWIRISDTPRSPISFRLLLLVSTGCSSIDLRFDLRSDGTGQRLLVERSAGPAAFDALSEFALGRQTVLPALVQCRQSDGAEGHPGGSGWIPWKPARPTISLSPSGGPLTR